MADDHGIHWTVREVAETTSTNADLLDEVDRVPDGPDHVVLRADHQTAGRGRLDRRWEAPPGANLLVSILFRQPPARPQVLTQAVACAALAAVDRWCSPNGVAAGLKWPNDLVVDDRKLAGVLAQRHETGPVVVGIGLNVGWAPDGAAALADLM
ncbi:MAG: biotin--[acetyl-CoA-carboxylase] ligase, partial [Actinomycetota bacterium]